ncbi:tRNA uracil 4-sulfurtransferase ThiI [Calderihabitans maritimus]|uniref:Probable tRNA sulfurtransferase n=1 Tax=Calderihabitans maritimus TaxID=1246530 RepID=A0A1Z5HV05_9FIRM|nr:tRNA uracil 4-sulfurtransferase ThiI [Calderihabitans maritimus]GAW93363.1 thiamine biosynthesis protein ThiI [Calderihabitans maritimus]
MKKVLLVRYGEITLKGKNRAWFEDMLLKNVKRALADLPEREIKKGYGRLYVDLKDDLSEVVERLTRVFGIVSVSPAWVVPLDLEEIKKAALAELESWEGRSTFKVETRRPYKQFPFKSPEISRQVGGFLLSQTDGWTVDVNKPEVVISIEVRQEGGYVYSRVINGPGGLPVGVTGKGILLLSGGIDSPVAGWMGMKRGVEIIGLHFYSFPFTSERSKEKVLELCRVLARYGGKIKLYINHFTEIQKAIKKYCPEELYVTIMRRMMFRLAEVLAKKEGAMAILTGESLGQVASQTLESMRVINEVTSFPVLRPLIALDKVEIIEYARRIGTYDISIQPYEDCCTLFVPKHPATRPKPEKVKKAEEGLDISRLIEESLAKTEIVEIEARPV